MLYLIAYDIRNGKRLNAVAKCCLRYGQRVGLSVFEANFETRERLEMFTYELSRKIDLRTDLVRIYRICENCVRERLILGCSVGENPTLSEGEAYVF